MPSPRTPVSPLRLVSPPLVGFGTFVDREDVHNLCVAIRTAVQSGCRHFDIADVDENRRAIGEALRGAMKEFEVDRSQMYICSKLWSTCHAPAYVETACREVLADLGCDYLDNYMIDWPVHLTEDDEVVHSGDHSQILETYRAMEDLVEKGLVRSLGVSNFDVKLLRSLLDGCRIRPLANQVEMHPYLAQKQLLEFCLGERIFLIAYSPLAKAGAASSSSNVLEDPAVVAIAQEVERTPAQVVLRWGVQRGACVIPNSLNLDHIRSNRDVLDWALDSHQLAQLDALDRCERVHSVPWYEFPEDQLRQPDRKEGNTCPKGVYTNDFGRHGKHLQTEIVVKRGILKELHDHVTTVLPTACLKAQNYVVTDAITDPLLGATVMSGFTEANIAVKKLVIPADEADAAGVTSSERFKNRDVFHDLIDQILAAGISKHSCIISLGGGVVNNLCGFLASVLYRGIALVHITTTMMGMVDAAIDFKQAINHDLGKNLLGAYHPADKIIIDSEVLATLSHRHILNGIAESLKHGLAQSSSLCDTIVRPLRSRGRAALDDINYLETVIKATLEIKLPTLDFYRDSDFNEMVPQYGHAIAHAVEHLSWHGGREPLLHGEAVAIGMCVTAEVAHIRGLCTADVVDAHYSLIADTFLPVFVPDSMGLDEIMAKLTFDKHYVEEPTMGLAAKIGTMARTTRGDYTFSIKAAEIRQAIEANWRRVRNIKEMEDESIHA
eukprot:TRINITY_DN7999_c0_g1_i1.p1 TRINITY_DN7999_c0_g1~~TRINITY_DN7999_c0_g1_i1.p1  ORF type:complete len:723 (-),score=157.74 TRINITY_DN7999_c0_g1_i1:170-2338(-)